MRLWNFYGQTEIAPLATVLKPEDQLRKPGSAGRPALNVETRVVDDAMRDVVPGEVGEIVHRSPQLLQGYFNDPERTAAAFEGGWFHSGDLATIDDEGYITVVDRKKDMIKTGGENVASREVEEAMYRLEGVSEVAVIGLPHPRWIEAVTAVVVVKAGHALDEARVIAYCGAAAGELQVPEGGGVRRRAAQEPERQAAQARAAPAPARTLQPRLTQRVVLSSANLVRRSRAAARSICGACAASSASTSPSSAYSAVNASGNGATSNASMRSTRFGGAIAS